MAKFFREFVSLERRTFNLRFGEFIASSLSGFVAGAVVASIVWITAMYLSGVLGQ